MTKDFAILICSKKPYRTLEDYALTLAGIPPLKKSAAKILAEDAESNRLYHGCLSALQQAVVIGDLQAVRNHFSSDAGEYICKYQDFIDWAISTGYMTDSLVGDATGQDKSKAETEVMNNENEQPKLKKDDKRNEVAKAWLANKKPNLDTMTGKQIILALEEFCHTLKHKDGSLIYDRKLFAKGGHYWLSRDHSVIPKRSPGCKSRK